MRRMPSQEEVGTPRVEQQEEKVVIRYDPSPQTQPGKGGGDGSAYITNLRRRKVDTYAVTEDELNSIDIQYWQASVLFSLACLAVGGMLSMLLSWDASGDWSLLCLLCIVAFVFGLIGIWIHRTRKTLLERIKTQTVQEGE